MTLATRFRSRLLATLDHSARRGEFRLPEELAESPSRYLTWLEGMRAKRWVVYAKRPLAGPEHVLRYLARYTHRVAISNGRLLELDGDDVDLSVQELPRGRRVEDWADGRGGATTALYPAHPATRLRTHPLLRHSVEPTAARIGKVMPRAAR